MWYAHMLVAALVAAAANALPVAALPVDKATETSVHPLDEDQVTGDSITGLHVVYYSEKDCTGCSELDEIFASAASFAASDQMSVAGVFTWSTVDCAAKPKLCSQLNVQHFPTVAVYGDGEALGEVDGPSAMTPRQLAEAVEKVATLGGALKGPGLARPDKSEKLSSEANITNNVGKSTGDTKVGSKAADAAAGAAAESVDKEVNPRSDAKDVKGLKRNDVPEGQDESNNETKDDDKKGTDSSTQPEKEEEQVSPIEALTDATYNIDHLKGLWVIKYFSPYCPHCVHFAPIYLDIFNQLGGDEGTAKAGVHIAEVNCVEQGDICGQAGITAIPAIFAMKDGSKIGEFEGAHKQKEVTEWIEKLTKEHGIPYTAGERAAITAAAGTADAVNTADAASTIDTVVDKVPLDKEVSIDSKRVANVDSQIASWAQFKASYSNGQSKELTPADYQKLVSGSSEPWMIKFYSPKCPHCVKMAPQWKEFAANVKGHINVGEVNCLEHTKFCIQHDISGYPTLRFVRGGSLTVDHDQTKGYSPETLEEFARAQSASQLLPVSTVDDFKRVISSNNKRRITTFVYFHDEAIVSEDISALVSINTRLGSIRSIVYTSDSEEVRKLCGITLPLSGIAMIHWTDVESTKPDVFTIRNGFIPEIARDVDKIFDWAARVRLASTQLVDATSFVSVFDYSMYFVLYIMDPMHTTIDASAEKNLVAGLDQIAYDLFRDNVKRQSESQADMRDSRHEIMNLISAIGKLDSAHDVYATKIDVPLAVDVAFAMGTKKDLTAALKGHLDVSQLELGDVIVGDLRAGKYLTVLDNEKITTPEHTLAALYAWEQDRTKHQKKSFKPMKKLRSWSIPDSTIDINRYMAVPRSSNWRDSLLVILIVVLAIVGATNAYKVYRKRQAIGPLLTGKMD